MINKHHLSDYLKKKALQLCFYSLKKILATEIYKVINDFSPQNTTKIFEVRNEYPYNLRQTFQFSGL